VKIKNGELAKINMHMHMHMGLLSKNLPESITENNALIV
jgi:hypothetical protein